MTISQKVRRETKNLFTRRIRNWDKVWVVTHNGNAAWKWTDPTNRIDLGACSISTDVWMDQMEAKGCEIIDDRNKPAGNVWD